MVHPRQVKVLRMDGHVLGDETIRNTGAFLGAYFILFMLSTLAVSIDNFDFTTNFTAVAATLNNIGPGLGLVGPTCNYNGFSIFSKFVLMLDMLAGRLELFPILILFKPGCWKKY